MKYEDGKPKTLAQVLTQVEASRSLEPPKKPLREYAAPKRMHWIDNALDRLRAIFTTWNVSDAAIVGLSAEWARAFGKWHVTQDVVDKAIDHCRDAWGRVPFNITKEFEVILQKAMTAKDIGATVASPSYSKQEHYYQIFDRIVKKIKSKNPGLIGQEGGKEINEMIQSHLIYARQQNPELVKDEPFSVDLIRFAERLA